MQPEENTECLVAHCISTARGVEAGTVQDGFLFWTGIAHDKVAKLEAEAALSNYPDQAAVCLLTWYIRMSNDKLVQREQKQQACRLQKSRVLLQFSTLTLYETVRHIQIH